MATPLTALVHDPQFYRLTPAERKVRLAGVSEEFRGLPDPEKDVAIQTLEDRWRAQTPAPAGQQTATASGGMLPDLQDVKLGWRAGAADLAKSTANVVAIVPGLDRYAQGLRDWSKRQAPTEQEMQGHEGIAHQVVQGVASAPAAILKYAPALALKRFAPAGAAVIGAVSVADEGKEKMAERALADAASFWAMGRAGRIKSRPLRAAASAAAAAVPVAVESGGDPKATAAAGLLGGAFGAVQPPTPPRSTAAGARVSEVRKSLVDDFASALNPLSRGGPAGPAAKTGRITRAHLGEMKQRLAQVEDEFGQYRNRFEGMLDKGERTTVFDTLDRIETGRSAQLAPEDKPFAAAARRVLDEQWKRLNDRGLLEAYTEDYFPRIWNRKGKAQQVHIMIGKRPFEGPKGFAKMRKFTTIKEGLEYAKAHPELGLELASENPVDLMFLKIREGERAILAHDVMQEMKQNGLLKFTRDGRPPEGYAAINDKAFKRMFKGKGGEWVLKGQYYAPEPAARVINNYLSPGLRDRPWFRGYLDLANSMNQFQLGFSFFHLGFSTIDAATHSVSLGIEEIVHGVRTGSAKYVARGAKEIAKAPFVAVEPFVPGWKDRGLTSQVWREYMKPGSQPQVAPIVTAMKEAGVQLRMDPFYRGEFRRKLRTALRAGDVFGSMFYGAGRMSDIASHFLMEYAVPRQKVGGFSRMAEFELSRLPANAAQDQVRAVMQKVADSVENRLGQVAYDNLFWHKTAKDLLMASIRSVGWNFGTFRELGGGAKDWASFTRNVMRPGVKAEFTRRMAYTTALPMVVGTLGAITNYILTGEYPQSMRDLFFPRTGATDEYGRPERVSFPSYIKDVYHYGAPFGRGGPVEGLKEAGKTVQRKMHPAITSVLEWMENEDWQGTEIRNADDPVMRQIIDTAQYFGKQYLPFSFRYMVDPRYSKGERVASFFGVTPAPVDVKTSNTEIFVNKFISEKSQPGTRTKQTAERQKQVREMERMARLDQDVSAYAQEQIDKGTITEGDVAKAEKRAEVQPLVRKFRGLPWKPALQAYEIAVKDRMVTDADRNEMHEILVDKIGNALDEIVGIGKNTQEQRRVLDTLMRLNLASREDLQPPQPPGVR